MFQIDEIKLDIPQAEVIYYPSFFKLSEANYYYNLLLKRIPWQQDDITVFGKTYKQPRLTALFGNNKKPYSYSNITMHPHLFTTELEEIKAKIENKLNIKFTSCLANLYRDGKDSNGWHADNEKALGKNPSIASVSFGEDRFFHLKHKANKNLRRKILLKNGSLLIMKGETQEHWLHQIAKTKTYKNPRVNLTFRVIK